MVWKAKFDAEMADLRKTKEKEEESSKKKLTGRQLFMADKTLNESDLSFLKEGSSFNYLFFFPVWMHRVSP